MEFKNSQISQCPGCSGPLKIAVMRCAPCDLEIRGRFAENPFSNLSEEMLYFLYVFVHCEGKIGEMEKALGISYPTVKNKLAQLKMVVEVAPEPRAEAGENLSNLSVMEILSKIENGQVHYLDGLKAIKDRKREGK